MSDFKSLGIKNEIVSVLNKLRYKEPFEVQKKIIPIALKGKNVVFTSETGSGKTLAFLLGFISRINKKFETQMVVLTPTRELCIQVGKEMEKICTPLGINVGVLYGGREIKGDHKTFRKKVHIFVGTPGRLIQHVNEKNIKVGEVKYLVYDESDQMFDHGFYKDCVYMKSRVSKDAQIIFSSATVTDKIKEFIKEEIKNHEFLEIGDQIPKDITQEKIYLDKLEKNKVILNMFKEKRLYKVIIFCNTKIKSHNISDFLNDNKIRTKSLNSDLDQKERETHLNHFKEGFIKVLVTTDIAARGLHINNIDAVINYDVPTRDEFYVHRIGRTGRKGKKGYSLTLICPEDEERFDNIEFDYNLKIKDIS